jgi:tetratricopeptide (TPR) repeat protein
MQPPPPPLTAPISLFQDDSGSSLASTRSHALLALYFDGEGHDMTGKLRKSELKAASRAGGDISTSAVLQAVCEYLLDCNLPLVAKRALDIMGITVKQGVEKSIFRLSMRLLAGRQAMLLGPSSWEAAENALATATEIDPTSADAWTHLAALQYEKGAHAESRNSYSIALELLEKQGQPAPLQLYLRLGLLFLDEGEAVGAKEVYLKGCRAAVAADGAVASLWLGVGTACLRIEEWEAAEQCLAEANILNNQNEKVSTNSQP